MINYNHVHVTLPEEKESLIINILNLMMTYKVVFTSLTAFVAGFMAPVFPYAGVCSFFVMLDVLSAWQLGVRIRRRSEREDRPVDAGAGRISSRKFGSTVVTLVKIYLALTAASMAQTVIVGGAPVSGGFNCLKFVAGAICVWQAISVLENESTCSDARWARIARRFLVDKTARHTGINLDDEATSL